MVSRRTRMEVLVGGFVTLGLVLFVLLMIFMGGLDTLVTESSVVEVDFDDVQSLQPGDPVFLLGMKAGRVVSIDLQPIEEGKRSIVRVQLRMPTEYRAHLRVGSRVKVDKSLTGNMSVLIQSGQGEPLPDGARLQGIPSADLGAVTEKVNQVLDEGEKLIKTINRMAGQLDSTGDLTRAIGELANLVRDFRGEMHTLSDQIGRSVEEVRQTLEENRPDIRKTLQELRDGAGAARVVLEKLSGTPEALDRSLAEVSKAAEAAGHLLGDNRPHIDTILEDLRQVSTNAANLTADIKRRPWLLLYRPDESEIQAMDLYDAAWAYNLGATELNRSLRDLAVQLDVAARTGATPPLLREAEARVRDSLEKQRRAEDAFWKKLRGED